jgi:hypothetical protein
MWESELTSDYILLVETMLKGKSSKKDHESGRLKLRSNGDYVRKGYSTKSSAAEPTGLSVKSILSLSIYRQLFLPAVTIAPA